MMKILSLLLVVFGVTAAHAASLVDTNGIQFRLNHGDVGSFYRDQIGTEEIKSREHSKKCTYSFAVQGGSSAAAINLLNELGKPCVLPNKAIIRDVLIDVVTAPTSLGLATIAVGSGAAANDLKTATAIASLTGLVAGVPVGSAATAIKLTADQKPTMTVAVAPLTAGKMNVHIKYQISE